MYIELELNTRIGMGEFGVVLEVSNIHLSNNATPSVNSDNVKPLHRFNSKSCGAFPTHLCHYDSLIESSSHHVQKLRNLLASKVFRETEDCEQFHPNSTGKRCPPSTGLRPRFAVKQIRKDLYPKKKIEAGKDLAKEAKLLSRLEHPNIIRLRGIVGQPGQEDFMLLLDRLGISLSEQVTQWQQSLTQTSAGMGFPWGLSTSSSSQRKVLERTILSERLLALYDVARAMHYLHQKA